MLLGHGGGDATVLNPISVRLIAGLRHLFLPVLPYSFAFYVIEKYVDPSFRCFSVGDQPVNTFHLDPRK